MAIIKKITIKALLPIIAKMIQDIQSHIKALNDGGCGCFAKILYNDLSKIGLKPKIVLFDDVFITTGTYNKYVNEVKHGNKIHSRFLGPGHVMIQLGQYYIDGYNLYPIKKYNEMKVVGTYSIDELNIALQELCSWNDEYDRNQNTKLNEIVGNYFGNKETILKQISI